MSRIICSGRVRARRNADQSPQVAIPIRAAAFMLLYVNQLQVKASIPILQFRSRCIKLMHFLGLSTVVVHAAQPYFAQRKRAFEPAQR
ncbi:hypothetical protein Bphy_7543 (plasmid) [Paraburkholderia phymatum STM815]|uniref:Uncharacterized protein n=1 Tax=Paraburkholderia phymatum (strain DSM 17167 / CIP 108236 / LMG 21445 / STM815) TaxID=391038 RepID=B2JXX0_PARP8|nr:hypothetical protein Bphy_7543 [Paraburkholderia phymatum STM815]